MYTTKIDKRGRITIPKPLRHQFGLKGGDKLPAEFSAESVVIHVPRRRRTQVLQEFLKSKKSVWKDQDHPELLNGTEKWIRKVRAESEIKRRRK